jgi:hypothetical protein
MSFSTPFRTHSPSSFHRLNSITISMRSRFFNADQNHMMVHGERDGGIPSNQSGISMSTSNDSDGQYQSANDTLEMVWEDDRELDNMGAIKSKNAGNGWPTTSNTATINSWTASSPFNTGPAVFGVPTWDSATGNNAFTASAPPTLGVPGDPFGQIAAWKPSLNIGQNAKESQPSQDPMVARATLHSGSAALSPLAFTAEELDQLASRAGGNAVGSSTASGTGIWGSSQITIDTGDQAKGLLEGTFTTTPVNGSAYQASNMSTDNAVKKPPQSVPVPAGRKLSSSIHAAAAAAVAIDRKPNKEQEFERRKPAMKNKEKEKAGGGRSWGDPSGQEKQQRKNHGTRKDKGLGRLDVSCPYGA